MSDNLEALYARAERALAARDFKRTHELAMRVLGQNPRYAGAYFLLASIALEHDNVSKALDVIGRALLCAPEQPRYLAFQARCELALNQPQQAAATARRALDTGPDDALTLDTLGVVLTRAGAHEDAARCYERAVAHNPAVANFHYNLGAAYQFLGRFDAAGDAYRAALARDADLFKAWSALAQLEQDDADGADALAMEAAFQRLGGAEARLHLGHALARRAELDGDLPRSLDWLEAAKAARAEELAYRIEDDLALFDAARQTVDAPAGPCTSEEPVFIVGMPRTGTTLVERILSSHPDVFSAGELSNFALVVKRAVDTPSNMVLDAPTLEAAATADATAWGEQYLASTRPRTGHTARFIDKMPLNFFYCGLIHRAFPRARIICLRRHPVDTCVSNYRQLFATGFSYYNYAYRLETLGDYYRAFDALMGFWRERLPATAFTEVHYEAVVDNLESEARRLVAFCGLPWDDACLAFQNNAAPVATASSVQVRRPLYASSIGRWRRYGERADGLLDQLGMTALADTPSG